MPFERKSVIRRFALGIVAAALALTHGSAAMAYCRTTVCNATSPGQACVPAQADDCGVPLRWAGGCMGFSIQEDGSRQVPVDTIEALTTQAFASWTNAPCADGTPSIAVTNLGRVECSQQEYNDEGGNANVVVFRDQVWPYIGQGNTLALTTVTYNLDTGEIFDVDLEVNGTDQVVLTTGDNAVQYDLLSILTHEAGHMLGLSHSNVGNATMKVEYVPGDTTLRQLSQDDIDGICAAYPPGRDISRCDPDPRRGLQSECGNPDEDDGCNCSLPGASPRGGSGPTWAFGLALLCALRRRQRS